MSAEDPQILVVDDEPQLQRFLGAALKSHGYRVLFAGSGGECERLAISHQPSAILLDLGLPDKDGLQVVTALRAWSDIPIIVISARGKEDDKVEALEAGANDYLTKPFGTRELIARIRVALRQRTVPQGASPILEVGDIRMDLESHLVTRAGERVHLTPNEFKLLMTLLRHPGKVLTHNQLLKEVWGVGSAQQVHSLRVCMNQLRQKLEADSARPRYLQTELGVGYRLSE
ncbi:MAG: two component transcriptional regulator, winged helix family [Holophagaceae bacterium]|nr:two component transcriptional regulator, winged helix family [Holophagaceae bacterium]